MAVVSKLLRYLIIAVAIAICPTWPDLMGHASVAAPAADAVGDALGAMFGVAWNNAHHVLLVGMILGGLLLTVAPRIITFPNILYGALIEVKYIKKSEKVVEEAKASLLAEARSQLERYAEDHNLAETWRLKPAGTVTLIRLALVFHGEELLFAEEI